MKKILLLFVLTLVHYNSFSQKLKVKGDLISIDKKEIAKIETGDEIYLLKDLEDNILAKINFGGEEATASITELWVEVTNPEETVTNEVSFKMTGITFNPKKLVADFIYKNLYFFDEKGIKHETIESFFSKKVERENKAMYDSIASREEEIISKISRHRIIEENGNIYNDRDQKVGSVTFSKGLYPTDPNFWIKVFDRDQKLIATFNPIVNTENFKLSGYDELTKKAKIEGDLQFRKTKLYNSILESLFRNGYGDALEFGIDQAIQMSIDEYWEKFEKSENILEKKGYKLEDDGTKIEAYITIYFEDIPVPYGMLSPEDYFVENNEGVVMAIDRLDRFDLGEVVRFQKVLNNTSGLIGKARDNVQFCVYLDNGDEDCYKGHKIGTAKYKFLKVK